LVNYRHWPVGILVYHFGITVHVIFCLSYGFDLAGTPFEDFGGTLFLKIWREFLLSLKSHPLLYSRIPRNRLKVRQFGVLFPIPQFAFAGNLRVKE
jgi:hypothetical protein